MGRPRVVRRGKQILSLLHERGDLADQEYKTAVRQIVSLRLPPLPRRPLKALHAILRLEKAVNRARHKGRLPSPPILKTTLDLALQEEVVWQAFDAMDRYRNRGVGNAAAIVADRKTGEVLALVGSGDYFDQHRAGAIDYTAVRRQTGSTLKPFIFARAIERGLISSCTILDDILRGPNDVENADHRFLGPLLPRFALANSRNVPASRLFQQMGLGDGYAFFSDLGFHDRTVPAEHYGLGLALGSMPVSLEALVRGYTALANDGMLLDLVWHEGQAVRAPRRIMDQGTARLITRFLADPMARLPSFPRMGASEYRFPVAVKTGTSSLLRDVWTVAWSNKYLVGVWLGHPDFLPMNGVSGFKTAAPLVKTILEYLHPESLDGLEDLSFPPPRGYKSVRVCSLTGKLSGPACDRVHLEWIQMGDEPVDLCDAHLFMALDSVSGRRVDDKTPPERIEVRAVTRLPSRYAPWLLSEGFSYAVDEGTTRRSDDRDNRLTGLSRLKGKGRVSVKILEPTRGSTLVIDPEVPSNRATIGLIAEVDPPAEQVVWYVDGSPFKVADYPYSVRWPLSRGEHTFRVAIPFVSYLSEPVTIMVR
jgi:penicillin-binding protein 1C